MKKLLSTLLIALCLTAVPASAQVKIAVVDLQTVFKEYYKTKEADVHLKEMLAGYKKEYQQRMGDYQKMVEEAGKIRDEANDPAISEAVRKEKMQALQAKVGEVKSFERQLREFDVTRRKQLDDTSGRMRKGIVDNITEVVNSIGKTKGFNIILDESGLTMNGTATVLYAEGLTDLTQEIINTLNAQQGATPAAPPAS